MFTVFDELDQIDDEIEEWERDEEFTRYWMLEDGEIDEDTAYRLEFGEGRANGYVL